MSAPSSSRRTDNVAAEHWQQQRGREATPTKSRRRHESNAQEPLPPATSSHRFTSSRRSLSRSPVPPFDGPAKDVAFDTKQAPKNFIPDHSLAITGTANGDPEDTLIPKKSSSRRRRSTVASPSPDPRNEARSTPQRLAKHEYDDGEFPKSLRSPIIYSQVRSPIQSDSARRGERQVQDQTVRRERIASPSPRMAFKEDIFLNEQGLREDTRREDSPLQSSSRQPPRTTENLATKKESGRIRGVIDLVSPPASHVGSSPKPHNVLHKKAIRQSRLGQKEVAGTDLRLKSTENSTRNQPLFRRRPESMVSPQDPWYRSFPSPPREDNRILLEEELSVAQTPSEPSPIVHPPFEREVLGIESHPDTGIRGRSRRASQSSRQVEATFDSTPPSSSGVTHYATASDHSLEPTITNELSREDSSARRKYPTSQKQRASPILNPRTPPFDLERFHPASTEKLSSERMPSTKEYNPYFAGPINVARHKTTRKQAMVSEVRDIDSPRSQGGLKSSLRHAPSLAASPSFPRPIDERPSARASPVPQIQASRTFLRNDDSMTYVAVTASASSPQSDSDQSDELSEASKYTDQDTSAPARSPIWNQDGRSPIDDQSLKRRDALLTGLGLGLSNLEDDALVLHGSEDNQREIVGAGPNQDTGASFPYFRQPESKSGYLVPDDDLHLSDAADSSSRRQETVVGYSISHLHSSSSLTSMVSPNTQISTPTPAGRRSRRSSTAHGTPRPKPAANAEHTYSAAGKERESPSTKGSRGRDRRPDDIIAPINKRSSKSSSRRDTWVYDDQNDQENGFIEVKQGPDDDGASLQDRRKAGSTINWSDRDSLDDKLSEGAQKMLNQLQDTSSIRELPRKRGSTAGRDEQYRWPNGQDENMHSPNHNLDEQEWPERMSHSSLGTPSLDASVPRTWRQTISSSAYQSLLERHGVIEMKRQDVIFELCETEMAFVKSMKLVLRLYSEPLKDDGQWIPGVPQGPSKLLEWLEDITNVHSQISSALHSARASQFPLMLHFADIIRPFVHRLEIHLPYLVCLEDVSKEIEANVRDSRSKFGEFVKTQALEPECGSMGLTSFLLKPMQRLTKYPLFFKQVWELTPRSHPDHLPMFSLYNSTEMVIKVIQEVKAREEELVYVKDLSSRIYGLPESFDLARRERRLIAQGLLRRVALSEKDREALDGFGTPSEQSRDPSPRPSLPPSPIDQAAPNTPPIPDLGKLGPITSPLFPRYHNKTPVITQPPSPFTPRRNFMSAVSRASTALSEASQSSEWMVSNSPTSSIAISSDFDAGNRPDSSASSVLSIIHSPFSQYSPNTSQSNAQRRSTVGQSKTSRRKGPREMPVYAFVFTDLVLLTTQTEKHGLFQTRESQAPAEWMSLVDNIGISRVLGVCDRSGNLDYDHLLQVDLLPVLHNDTPQTVVPVYLTLPTTNNSRMNLKPAEQMKEAKDKWLAALDRSYGYTLRSLTFPSLVPETSEAVLAATHLSVMTLLASGHPLPKSPTLQAMVHGRGESTHDERDKLDTQWWSNRFRQVLHEMERAHETPVMLIGDVALTMGRGLKRVHTTDRTKRNGPQQLLLAGGTALKSSSTSSGSSNSRKSLLNLKRR